MRFEWDENKRHINLQRHGLDFEDAHLVFTDEAFVIEDPHDDYEELRYILQGMLDQFFIIVVFTVPNDEIVRIISMRKANKREQKNYVQKRFG
ncbi:MAG: BrnT family toxin [Gammaproteobacteria bacterium]|nr:BrnT family toxin [Gammaproteobacteria bacterium]